MESAILLRKARRLRRLTGNTNLRSQSEVDQAKNSGREFVTEALLRPFQLMLEPAVLVVNLYIALACESDQRCSDHS